MIEPDNIREAIRLAARDKGDMPAVHRAMADPEAYAQRIIQKLQNNK